MSGQRVLAAIMFTDIFGYTTLMGKDSKKAMELVRLSKDIQKPLVEKHQGKWIKEMGDGVIAQFNTALDAVNCAVEIQRISRADFEEDLRIGIHFGDITIENGDVYGDGVNVASRLESIADPGGVYISESIEKAMRGQQDIQAKYLGEVKLKNVDYDVRTYALHGVGLPVPSIGEEKGLTGQFWAELERRGVIRAGGTYVVVSLLLLMSLPYAEAVVNLPEWSTNALLVTLAVGFPIAIYMAWSFERSPEGFVRTTSSTSWQNPYSAAQRKPMTSNFIISVLVLVIIAMFLYPRYLAPEDHSASSKGAIPEEVIDKSIAVLPFKNLSTDQENQYFADGVQEAILNHLSKIGALKVISRTSVEQYRGTVKPMSQIGSELEVGHILEGSAQKSGDKVRITVQLIRANQDQHLWSEKYDRELTDIFTTQSEIAKRIADELEAQLNPQEQQLIENTPTSNVQAYDYYLRGRDYQRRYIDTRTDVDYENTIKLYRQSLESDPEFALAYVGIAQAYYARKYFDEYLAESPLDSVLVLCNKAIEIDPNLAEAYVLRGRYYYYIHGSKEKAISDLEKALKIDPNHVEAYSFLSRMNIRENNFPEALRNLKKASVLVRGKDLLAHYEDFAWFHLCLGEYEQSANYYKEIIKLEPDNIGARSSIAHLNRCQGKWVENLAIAEQLILMDRT